MPRIAVPYGTELFYRDWGAGRPVVFAHGMLLSSSMWQYQMLHLAENGFRAVAYDRRGHGRSDDPGKGYEFGPLETCGRKSASLIPRSQLVVYSNAAHMPHLSHREQLNADLLSFARQQD